MLETAQSIPQQERMIIARYMSRNAGSVKEIVDAAEAWPGLARQAIERRLSALTDVLSTETLLEIAEGRVDLASLCKSIAEEHGLE